MSDTIGDLPDYPQEEGVSTDVVGYSVYAGVVAHRYLSSSQMTFSASKSSYRFKASPSAPITLFWYEYFVPYDTGIPEIVEVKKWNLTEGQRQSGDYEIKPDVETKNGVFYDPGKEERSGNFYLSLLQVDFITPAGDPVNAPVDAGTAPGSIPDGANEFTFSNAASGVLTMKLKARVSGFGSMPAAEKAKFTFEVDGIGASAFAWDAGNPGGKASGSGDFITATATFSGLPQNNTDLGLKKARVKYDSSNAAKAEFEVFYSAKAKNHPGGVFSHTNWFHYYKQNAGGGAYGYNDSGYKGRGRSGSNSAGGDSSIIIGPEAFDGDTYITTNLVGGRLRATGWSNTTKYYANFSGVLAHERQHANGEVAQGGSNDPDSDWLATDFEIHTSKTNPNDPFSASSGVAAVAGFTDDEVYAGGPVEENGIKKADTSKDWANPGTNHKP